MMEYAEKGFTDSFHGLAFCLNFNKKFSIVERNYGVASAQSSRIDSLLQQFELQDMKVTQKSDLQEAEVDYDKVNHILSEKREYSINYLKNALQKVEQSCE